MLQARYGTLGWNGSCGFMLLTLLPGHASQAQDFLPPRPRFVHEDPLLVEAGCHCNVSVTAYCYLHSTCKKVSGVDQGIAGSDYGDCTGRNMLLNSRQGVRLKGRVEINLKD